MVISRLTIAETRQHHNNSLPVEWSAILQLVIIAIPDDIESGKLMPARVFVLRTCRSFWGYCWFQYWACVSCQVWSCRPNIQFRAVNQRLKPVLVLIFIVISALNKNSATDNYRIIMTKKHPHSGGCFETSSVTIIMQMWLKKQYPGYCYQCSYRNNCRCSRDATGAETTKYLCCRTHLPPSINRYLIARNRSSGNPECKYFIHYPLMSIKTWHIYMFTGWFVCCRLQYRNNNDYHCQCPGKFISFLLLILIRARMFNNRELTIDGYSYRDWAEPGSFVYSDVGTLFLICVNSVWAGYIVVGQLVIVRYMNQLAVFLLILRYCEIRFCK